MDSSFDINSTNISRQGSIVNPAPLNDDGDEAVGWNIEQQRLHLSTSFLTSCVDIGLKSLPLIHQDPTGWNFVSESLKLMAAGKGSLEVVLYLIETYLQQFSSRKGLNVEILKKYFESLKEAEKNTHKDLFCELAKLILRTPELFPNKMNLLVPGEFESVSLSKTQCLCLVAHMFMCISLSPNEKRVTHFGLVFDKPSKIDRASEDVQMGKIKCLINYFTQALKETAERMIIFERIAAEKLKDNHGIDYYKIGKEECSLEAWTACTDKLLGFSFREGEIKGGSQTIEIGFSGKSFGGETLKFYPTQQERRILRSPECLPGYLLFPGQKNDGEAFCITGARYFNQCSGNERDFKWKCSEDEKSSEFSTKKTSFIDALDFKYGKSILQFSPQGIQRELTKAFVGFLPHENDGRSVSTGGWGCGYYEGNIYLKFLIQWIAASRANRKLEFYSFKDKRLNELIEKLQKYYNGKEVKDLMADLLVCAKQAPEINNSNFDLFTAMKKEFNWK